MFKSHALFASLIAGAMGLSALASRAQPGPTKGSVVSDSFRKILVIQIKVHDGSKVLHQIIESSPDKKLGPQEKKVFAELLAKQKAIIVEMTRLNETLNMMGVAVAFPEVREEVLADMKRIQSRLESNDVGLAAQAVQRDIVDSLQEMVQLSLKKC